jgi:hypothetical protein
VDIWEQVKNSGSIDVKELLESERARQRRFKADERPATEKALDQMAIALLETASCPESNRIAYILTLQARATATERAAFMDKVGEVCGIENVDIEIAKAVQVAMANEDKKRKQSKKDLAVLVRSNKSKRKGG